MFTASHRALDALARPSSVSWHSFLRSLGVISYCGDATLARAVRATVERPIRLDAMADDLAATVVTARGELVYSAFETVEGVRGPVAYDLKRHVVVVPTHFTFGHV